MTETSQSWDQLAEEDGPALARPSLALSPVLHNAIALAATAIAGAWIGFYLLTPLPFIAVETFRATVTLHLVTGLVLIPYLISLVIGRRLPGGTPLDLPVMLLLSVYLIATAASLDWRLSLEVTMTALMAIAVFYVLSDRGLFRRWQIELALMLAVLAMALRTLWVVGDDYLDWLRFTHAVTGGYDLIPPTVPKVHDVGDHPNLLGGIMAATLPFFIVALFRSWPRYLRAFVAVAALAVLLAAFFSLARSAWVGAAFGVGTTLFLIAAFTPQGSALLRRLWPDSTAGRWIATASALAVAVFIAAGVLFAANAIEARPLWLFRPSGEPRVDAMGAGAEMVRDYPLLGTGPGVYSLLYPDYSGKNPNHAFHSHNGFLQAGVDMGLAGGTAMAILAGATVWLIIQGLRRSDSESRLSITACAGGLVAFAAFSLLDAPNGFKGPLITLAALGAVLALSYREGLQEAGPSDAMPESWRQFASIVHGAARVVIPVAAAGLLIVWARLDAAHFYYSGSIGPQTAQQWQRAIDKAERAVELDPGFAPYRLQLGAIEGGAYLETNDPRLLESAISQLERAVEIEPRSAIGHANLARLFVESGDREGARREAELTIEHANSDLAVVLVAGTALEDANLGTEATEAYAYALYLDAGLGDSPFWDSSAFRRERFGDILASSVVSLNSCLMLRYYLFGVHDIPITREEATDGCRLAAVGGSTEAKVTLAEALIDEQQLSEARLLLDDVLSREPDNGAARTALGSWYAAQDQTDQAREQWLRAAQLDQVDAIVLLGDSYPPGQVPPEVVDRLRGEIDKVTSQVQFHITGILYYRFKFFRGSPQVILLPGEWTQAVPGRYANARDALDRWTNAP